MRKSGGYDGIALTGPRGAGKSAVARALCSRHRRLQLVTSLTTRASRLDDRPGEYEYLSTEQFMHLSLSDILFIGSQYDGHWYGITRGALKNASDGGRVPLLIVGPQIIRELNDRGRKIVLNFLTVFLDCEDGLLDERLAQRGGRVDRRIEDQRRADRTYDKDCIHKMLNKDLEETLGSICDLWRGGGR